MAGSPSSPAPPEQPASENQVLQSNQLDPSLHPPLSSSSLSSSSPSSSSNVPENPNSNPSVLNPPPPLVQSFQPTSISAGAIPPSAPSFRPVTPIPMSIPQFSSIPNPNMQNPNFQNPNIQNPNVQPPGVNPVSIMLPGVASGAGAVTVSVSPLRPSGMYPGPPYPQMPNGYPTMPPPAPQGAIPPPVS